MKPLYLSSGSTLRIPRSPNRKSLWKRTGKTGIAILIPCTLLILAAFGLVAFLWIASKNALNGDETPVIWARIVNAGWTTKTVTLASVVIRMGIALQAGLLTAMMASIIIEVSEVRLSRLPRLSTMRGFSMGPQNLAWPALTRSLGQTPWWCVLLICSTLVISIASQFTSTLLLLDFANEIVTLGTKSSEVGVGLRYNSTNGNYDFTNGVNYWSARPTTYPRFAEYSEQPNNIDGVQDTGLTYRALLPFDTEANRGSLRNFTGITKVIDSRYVCVRPMVSNLAVEPFGDNMYRMLRGTVILDAVPSVLQSLPGETVIKGVDFSCIIVLPDSAKLSNNASGRTSICRVAPMANMKSSIQGLKTPSTASYLMLNATGTAWPSSGTLEGLNATSYKSWSLLSSSDHQINLGASVCFGNIDAPANFRVNVWSQNDYQEPSPQWDSRTQTWITEPIRELVCKTCSDPEDGSRAVVQLENFANQANWSALMVNTTSWFGIKDTPNLWLDVQQGFTYDNQFNGSMLMAVGVQQRIHRAHIAVFGDVLRVTGNPAIALQSLFTILNQMAYYDWLSLYDITAPAEVVMSESAYIPRQWIGFSVVGGIIGVHLMLVTTIFLLFWSFTEVSMLGNSWFAVAQVSAIDTREIMEYAYDLRDRDVAKALRSSGRDFTIKGLGRWR
ncbi:hypothetical protein PT974_09430 [Cladobotryum mycophilum]|uniref:Uncharacterized protein n=1 Tax=Cladobotryum mycophilum TaxID=491253 RepID=A0ABR0SG47_9HYPO